MMKDDIGYVMGKMLFDFEEPIFLEAMLGNSQKISYVDDCLRIIIPKNWKEIRDETGKVVQFVPGLVDLENSSLQFAFLS